MDLTNTSKFISLVLRHKPEAIGITLDEHGWAEVGSRHGKPVVYRIASGRMHKEGYVFFRSVNGVWLTKTVPVKYMEKL